MVNFRRKKNRLENGRSLVPCVWFPDICPNAGLLLIALRVLGSPGFHRPLRFSIDAGFVEGLWLADGQRSGLPVEFLEEATQVSGVAGAAGLLDLKEEHIAVAIRKPATDFLRVTTGLTLEPEFFS